MISLKEYRSINGTHERQRAFRHYKPEVQRGLGLGVTFLTDIPFDLRGKLVSEIANNLVSLSEELDIPFLDIGLMPESEEAGLIDGSSAGNYPLARVLVTPEHPQGILEFSSIYFNQVVAFRMEKEDQERPKPHEWVEAYGAFHASQHRGESGREGLVIWAGIQPEVSANQFANRWLQRVVAPQVIEKRKI